MIKSNRKSFKCSLYEILTAGAVIFSSSPETKASLIREYEKLAEKKIIRPITHCAEDSSAALRRTIRIRSGNPLENMGQSLLDCLEDCEKTIQRKIIEPIADILKDLKLLK